MLKDTNRKIRMPKFIYICGSKNGSRSSAVNSSDVWGDVSRMQKAMYIIVTYIGIWNQSSNTVIYEKCCSYLSISIFTSDYQPFLPINPLDIISELSARTFRTQLGRKKTVY